MKPRLDNRGLNLIEVMIVMVIVGAMIATVAPRLGGTQNETRAFLRNFTALSRQLHSQARLQNRVYRIAVSFVEEKGVKGVDYWVESGPSGALLKTPEQREKELDRLKGSKEPPKSDFDLDGSIMKKKQSLRKNINFKDVEFKSEGIITQGTVFIHFFPQGITQEAMIHMMDAKGEISYSLYIQPLTGETQIYPGEKALRDLQ